MTPNTQLTALTDDTTYYNIVTAHTNGTFLNMPIHFKAVGDTVLALIQLYVYNGTTRYGLDEVIPVPLHDATTAIPSWGMKIHLGGLLLESGWTLQAKQSVANTIDVVAAFTDNV